MLNLILQCWSIDKIQCGSMKKKNENIKIGQERRRTSGTCARTSFLSQSLCFYIFGSTMRYAEWVEKSGKDDEVVVVVVVNTWSNLFSLPPFPKNFFTLHKRLKPKWKKPTKNNNFHVPKIVRPSACPCCFNCSRRAPRRKKHLLRKENTRKRRLRTDKIIFSMIFSFFPNPPSLNPSSPAAQQALQLAHRIDAFHPDQGWKEIKTKTNQKTSWAEVRTIKRKWEKEKKERPEEETRTE